MPIHFGVQSRRHMIKSGATAFGLLVFKIAKAAPKSHRIALLSDTHIPHSAKITAHGVNMTDNLNQVISEITQRNTKPEAVLINGDCAYLKGTSADYRNLSRCVKPLAEHHIPLHLTMGNHDDRGPLYDELNSQKPSNPLVAAKHVSLLETTHANWFLLDSLLEVDVVTGEFGETQLAWLAAALDERPDKPAVIVAHHNPVFTPPPEGKRWPGLKDSKAFFDLITKRKHVKAYVYGHTHNWSVRTPRKHAGIHLINLPPVAYVFKKGQPNGWVLAEEQKNGLLLTLHTLDPNHSANLQQVQLEWR